MKQEYDFSNGERGKFFDESMEANIPVFLDKDVSFFMQKLAKDQGRAVDAIVNDWLRRNVELVQSLNK